MRKIVIILIKLNVIFLEIVDINDLFIFIVISFQNIQIYNI